jgi:hypothetical protein
MDPRYAASPLRKDDGEMEDVTQNYLQAIILEWK